MKIERFQIKGMVCSRCLKVLNNELRASGAEVLDIKLGEVEIKYDPSKINHIVLKKIINDNDFEIIWNDDSILAEQIKRWVINYVWNSDFEENLSSYLVVKLNKKKPVLSKTFSKVFGKTIERYYLKLKIERTKECIENKELSFGEIAFTLGYQNLSALSKQFKKETGMTMKDYKDLDIKNRIPIDKI